MGHSTPRRGGRQPSFNTEQDRLIRAEYDAGASLKQLAARWGGCCEAIGKAVRRAGGTLRHKSTRTFSLEEEAAIAAEYSADTTSTCQTLAAKHDVRPWVIRSLLRRHKVQRRSYDASLPVDSEAFSCAEDSEAAAYYVGLLMADGSISLARGTPTIKLALAEEDAAHVWEFRTFLKSEHAVSVYNKENHEWNAQPLHSIQIGSRQLADDLASYGVLPDKTQREEVFRLALDRHFWRGMICGDGSVGREQDGKPFITLASSRRLMEQYRTFCLQFFQTDSLPSPSNCLWHLYFNGARAYRLIEALFAGATVGLARKTAVAKAILAECREWKDKEPRPHSYRLTPEQIETAYKWGGDWKTAARLLGVSLPGLHHMRKQLGMPFHPRRKPGQAM